MIENFKKEKKPMKSKMISSKTEQVSIIFTPYKKKLQPSLLSTLSFILQKCIALQKKIVSLVKDQNCIKALINSSEFVLSTNLKRNVNVIFS